MRIRSYGGQDETSRQSFCGPARNRFLLRREGVEREWSAGTVRIPRSALHEHLQPLQVGGELLLQVPLRSLGQESFCLGADRARSASLEALVSVGLHFLCKPSTALAAVPHRQQSCGQGCHELRHNIVVSVICHMHVDDVTMFWDAKGYDILKCRKETSSKRSNHLRPEWIWRSTRANLMELTDWNSLSQARPRNNVSHLTKSRF